MFDKFFNDISFLNNNNLIEYAQKLPGYDISATIIEHIMLIFYGNGSNS